MVQHVFISPNWISHIVTVPAGQIMLSKLKIRKLLCEWNCKDKKSVLDLNLNKYFPKKQLFKKKLVWFEDNIE